MPGSGIIWLASYPKSGNTWVRLFLGALKAASSNPDLIWRGPPWIATSRIVLERTLDLDLADLSWQEAAELRPLAYRALAAAAREPFVMKVHDLYGTTPSGATMFPPEATFGCVHLVRDPRDVCLSYAAYPSLTVDRVIEVFGEPTLKLVESSADQLGELRGCWSSHGESWLAAPIRRLTVRYEDMVADPLTWLGRIAGFCGIDADEQAVARAVTATTFETLAAREIEHGYPERPDGLSRFFRAGKVGQWRAVLSPEQIARIERDHGVLMRRFGYELVSETTLDRSCSEARG